LGGNGHKRLNRAVGLPAVAEYDPTRPSTTDGEWLDLDSLVRQSQRAAVLISRLSLGQ
jgi:glutamate carboxypeptidase